MTSSNDLFCPQPKDVQISVLGEERNQKILTFKNLESENFELFFLKLLNLIVKLILAN